MNILWRIYFYIYALPVVVLVPGYPIASVVSEQYQFTTEITIDLITAAISLAGLYGFVYKTKVLNQLFCLIYSFLLVAWHFLYPIITSEEINLSFFLSSFIFWPLYFALFSYGLNRNIVWSENNAT